MLDLRGSDKLVYLKIEEELLAPKELVAFSLSEGSLFAISSTLLASYLLFVRCDKVLPVRMSS